MAWGVRLTCTCTRNGCSSPGSFASCARFVSQKYLREKLDQRSNSEKKLKEKNRNKFEISSKKRDKKRQKGNFKLSLSREAFADAFSKADADMHSFRQTFLRSFNPSNNDVSQQSLLCSVISLSFPLSTNYTFLRRLQRKSQVLPAGKKQFLICHIVSAEWVSRVLVRQNRHVQLSQHACLPPPLFR